MEILAGAAGHLSAELKARHPRVDWRRTTGFRNVLAHGYLDLKLDLIWAAITGDLPAIEEVIRAELNGGQLRDLGRG